MKKRLNNPQLQSDIKMYLCLRGCREVRIKVKLKKKNWKKKKCDLPLEEIFWFFFQFFFFTSKLCKSYETRSPQLRASVLSLETH